MTDQIRIIGQSLLNAELYNGLAAKDAENHALRMAAIGKSRSSNSRADSIEKENIRLKGQAASDTRSIHALSVAVSKSNEALVKSNQELLESSKEWSKACANRDALLLEWMHSQYAFKLLARKFGSKLGISVQEQFDLIDNEVINVSAENPRFLNTKLNDKAIASLKARK